MNDVQTNKKKFNWKEFWDKVSTGILLFLFATPVLILLYIVIWFLNK